MNSFSSFDEFITFWLDNPNEDITFKKYYVSKGMLYINNIKMLPFARLSENILYIEFSIIHKKIIKFIIPILDKLNTEFYLVKNFTKYHLNKEEFSIRFEDLDNMIDNYIIKDFYVLFKEINFDLQKHIFRYITKYDCYVAWNELNDTKVKRIKDGRSHGMVNKDIVHEISTIDRNFKILSVIE